MNRRSVIAEADKIASEMAGNLKRNVRSGKAKRADDIRIGEAKAMRREYYRAEVVHAQEQLRRLMKLGKLLTLLWPNSRVITNAEVHRLLADKMAFESHKAMHKDE